ncbi:MAG: hypothetical protein ABSF43_00710 [Rectinemataceae bacterium]
MKRRAEVNTEKPAMKAESRSIAENLSPSPNKSKIAAIAKTKARNAPEKSEAEDNRARQMSLHFGSREDARPNRAT